MTVFALMKRLAWMLVTRQVRPNDLVIREFSPATPGFIVNNTVYVEARHLDSVTLIEIEQKDFDEASCRLFSHNGYMRNGRSVLRID